MPFNPFSSGVSPEANSGPPSPARNVVVPPVSDRMGGALQQANGKLMAVSSMVRKGLQLLSVMLKDSDPKTAADLETMAAKLLKIASTANIGPSSVANMAAAGGGMASPMSGMPPPAAPGNTGTPLGGPLQGLSPTMMGR